MRGIGLCGVTHRHDETTLSRSPVRTALCGVALVTAAARLAGAQSACPSANSASAESRRVCPAPLDRRVSVYERGVALREALDRLAAAARIRFAYTAELLPLDWRVCVWYRDVGAGSVLVELLRGVPVEPVAADGDRVVLAPSRESDTPSAALSQRAGVLERVVVTGTVNGSAQRAIPVALDVVDGRDLARRDVTSLSSILDGAVPGIWMWEQSPTSLVARYASIPRRELVRPELSKGVRGRHRARELTSRHRARCRIDRPR